jgi:hypothetical protein
VTEEILKRLSAQYELSTDGKMLIVSNDVLQAKVWVSYDFNQLSQKMIVFSFK